MVKAEYTQEYMVERLLSWTPYTSRWLNQLSHQQLRALFRKKQQEVIYSITKDPANKPKPSLTKQKEQKQGEAMQLTLGI
jgi:hypothetical protein